MGLEKRAVTITRRCHPSRQQFVQPVWSPKPSCDSLQMSYELSMPWSLAHSLHLSRMLRLSPDLFCFFFLQQNRTYSMNVGTCATLSTGRGADLRGFVASVLEK